VPGLRRIFSFLFLFPLFTALPVLSSAEEAESGSVTVTAVGDVMLYCGPIEEVYQAVAKRHPREKDYIYDFPFKNVKPYLQGIVFCNMEGPLTDHDPVPFKGKDEIFYFSVPSRFGKALKNAGFKVASVANNHIKDCGTEGIEDSIRNLKKWGIRAVGAGPNNSAARKPVILKQNGLRVAFLAYDLVPPKPVWADSKNPGAAHANTKGICRDVAAAKKKSDVVLVSLHWGPQVYFEKDVMPADDRMDMAHAIIDAGASAVLGAHSHMVEKIERYREGVIFYGLGNFVFGSTYKSYHPYSVIAQLTLDRDGLVDYQVIPLLINPSQVNYCPRLLEGKQKDDFEKRICMEPVKDNTWVDVAKARVVPTPSLGN
jgi:poly-gamma-glutamate synthesis protein (capsule biosynthesis protein)